MTTVHDEGDMRMTTTYQTGTVGRAVPADSAHVYARAALAFGIVGAVWLSVILGIAALVQTDSQEKGRGLAIAGLAVSGVWIALFFALTRWHVG